jgi:protein TonB
MIMKTRKNFRLPANIMILMILPFFVALFVLIPACNQSNKQAGSQTEVAPPPPPPPPAPIAKTDSDTPLEIVDEMPVFKGGDAAIIDYLKNNTKYPEPAKLKGTQGKVIVRFAVEADGSIDKVSIIKSVDPELDKEALRVVGTMPGFEKPGIKDGKAVSVWYMLPINFTLN